MKKYEVAVGNGIVLKCKMVSDEEYADLLEKNNEKVDLELLEREKLLLAIKKLEEEVINLKHEVSVLKGEE